MDQNDKDLIPIPLPTEIPEPPPLDKLPLDVLHSATVEMLIQQNEDLSARLKVNIRRNSVQEQEILKLKKEMSELTRANENLKAQNEIIKEKEAIWYAQKEAKNKQMSTYDKELKLMEIRYNELYTTSRFRQKEIHEEILSKNNQIKGLKRKLQMLKNIKEKGKDRIREFLLLTGESVQNELLQKNKLQGQYNLSRRQMESLKGQYEKREGFLKNKIVELSELSKNHIRTLEKQLKDHEKEIHIRDEKIATMEQIHEENLTQAIGRERDRQRELEIKIEDLKNLMAKEGNSKVQVQKLSAELSELQNEKIQAMRGLEDDKGSLQIENTRLADMNTRLRNDNASLSTQLHEHKKILESCEKQLVQVNRDNEQLEKELENIKTLWVDIQSKYEKELVKVQSLTKLNRQLSENIFDTKVEKAIDQAQQPEQTTRHPEQTTRHPEQARHPERSEGPNPERSEGEGSTNDDDRINSKLASIYASQYAPMRDQDLDI